MIGKKKIHISGDESPVKEPAAPNEDNREEGTENSFQPEENNEETNYGEGNHSENKPGEKEDKYNELYDKYLRLNADFDNFRRRTAKEKSEIIMQANKDLILAILPVVDDFERAMDIAAKAG